jgi:hypothetical protein
MSGGFFSFILGRAPAPSNPQPASQRRPNADVQRYLDLIEENDLRLTKELIIQKMNVYLGRERELIDKQKKFLRKFTRRLNKEGKKNIRGLANYRVLLNGDNTQELHNTYNLVLENGDLDATKTVKKYIYQYFMWHSQRVKQDIDGQFRILNTKFNELNDVIFYIALHKKGYFNNRDDEDINVVKIDIGITPPDTDENGIVVLSQEHIKGCIAKYMKKIPVDLKVIPWNVETFRREIESWIMGIKTIISKKTGSGVEDVDNLLNLFDNRLGLGLGLDLNNLRVLQRDLQYYYDKIENNPINEEHDDEFEDLIFKIDDGVTVRYNYPHVIVPYHRAFLKYIEAKETFENAVSKIPSFTERFLRVRETRVAIDASQAVAGNNGNNGGNNNGNNGDDDDGGDDDGGDDDGGDDDGGDDDGGDDDDDDDDGGDGGDGVADVSDSSFDSDSGSSDSEDESLRKRRKENGGTGDSGRKKRRIKMLDSLMSSLEF